MQVDVQVYKVQALPQNNSYCSVVNVVNNCDGTSTLQHQNTELYYGALVNQLLQ
jgi:hypothetical protein